MTGDQATSGAGRSGAITAAGVLLLILTTPYALLAAVFGAEASMPGLVIRIGRLIVPSGLGFEAMVSCLVLLALFAYAGLATIFRWRGWRPVAAAVAWLTIALGAFCVWIWLAGRIAGFSPVVPVVLFALAGFVLWCCRQDRDTDVSRR
jgi:hypothetical protein